MISHFFDIDTLIKIDNKVWIVDKTNPNIPIIKISTSDFNLIKNGVYKSQGNKVDYNGQSFWLPTDIFNKLKVKLKLNNGNLGNIGISMQEFLNKDIIDNIDFKINLNNITHLKNKTDDIYIICSKQNKKNYETVLNKLEEKLKEEGLKIKNFYYISETFYNQNDDDIRYNKIKLLLQHLVGYRTFINKFTDEEITRYDTVHLYDNQYDTIKIVDEANQVLKSILKKTDDGLKSVIKEDISEYKPALIVNQITDNDLNKKITKKVIIDYSNLIKTFESFKIFENNSSEGIPPNFYEFIKNCCVFNLYGDKSESEIDMEVKKIFKSFKYEELEKWTKAFEDIQDILTEISDKLGSSNIYYDFKSYGAYKGQDIDALSVRIDAEKNKGFKGKISKSYFEKLIKRRLPNMIIDDYEYSENSEDISEYDDIYDIPSEVKNNKIWSSTFLLLFKSDIH